MVRKLAWGVLGATGIADRRTIPEGILPAWNARLVAVQSRDAGRARRVGAKHGAAAYVRDAGLLADPRVGAVYIATPVDRHLPQVLAAARAGKHVLLEKPMGLSVREAERMVRACRAAGVKLGVGFMMRFHPAHEAVRRWIREGRLGTPVLARAQLTAWYPPALGAWRQDPRRGGGGAVPDLAVHCIDLLSFLLGPVRSVQAEAGTLVHGYRVDDTAAILLRFASGAMGMIDVHFSVPDAACENVLEVYGSRGAVKAVQTIGQGQEGEIRICMPFDSPALAQGVSSRKDPLLMARGPGRRMGRSDFRYVRLPRRNVYRAQIEAFSAAVLAGKEPSASGRAGLVNQRILEAVYRSAGTGRRVLIH